MRTRLFLSAAVATLSLCLSQGYAQNVQHGQTGGEAATQGESTHARKPGQGAAQRDEQRAEEQKSQHGAREADKPGRASAAKKEDEKGGATAREEDKPGATTRKEEKRGTASTDEDKHDSASKAKEKHGAAAHKEEKKGQRHGAADENRDRTPTAQGGRETNRPDEADRAGGRMGKAGNENEGRATQAETDRFGRTGQREQRGAEAGRDAMGRGADRFGGRESEGGRDLQTGREMQQRGREAQRGQEAQGGREARGGRDFQGDRGGRIQLSQRDQTRVRQIISQQNVQSVSPNIFSPRIGAVLPPSVQFYPLPPAVISAFPQFEGYNFVMVGDDIAIIDPSDREVVTVLDEGGIGGTYGYGYGEEERGFGGGYEGGRRYEGREGRAERYGSAQREERFRGGRERRGEAYGYAPRVRLDNRQERALYRGVINEAKSNLRQVCVRVGERVPQSVDLEPVPRNIAAEAPDASRYDYFVLNDQVVLVDPDTRIVVDIIEEPR